MKKHAVGTSVILILASICSCKSGAFRGKFVVGGSRFELDNDTPEFGGVGVGAVAQIGGSVGGSEDAPGPIELGARFHLMSRIVEAEINPGFDTRVTSSAVGIGPYIRINTRNLLAEGGANFFIEGFFGASRLAGDAEASGSNASVDYDADGLYAGGAVGVEFALDQSNRTTMDIGVTAVQTSFEADDELLADADGTDVLFTLGVSTRF